MIAGILPVYKQARSPLLLRFFVHRQITSLPITVSHSSEVAWEVKVAVVENRSGSARELDTLNDRLHDEEQTRHDDLGATNVW